MPGERGYLFFTTCKGSLWASNILGHFIHVKFFPGDSEKGMRGFFFFSPHIKLIEKLDGKPKVLIIKRSIQQEAITMLSMYTSNKRVSYNMKQKIMGSNAQLSRRLQHSSLIN